jgi:hypothetical protein
VQALEEHAAREDLALEPRLFHPFSTEFQLSWFWRVDYAQGTKHNTIFLLGSAHGCFPARALPFSVLKHMGYADTVLSEIGAEILAPYRDGEDLTAFPIEKALKKDGTYFGKVAEGDKDGWLALVPDYLREPLKNIVKRNLDLRGFDEEVLSKLHLLDPILYVQTLQPVMEAELGVQSVSTASVGSVLSTGCMDIDVSMAFSKDGKPVLALEDKLVRKDMERKALKAGQTHRIDILESDIETLRIWLLSQPEDDPLREKDKANMLKEMSNYEEAVRGYRNGCVIPDEEDKTDYYTNFRNQYWIENTLSQVLQSKGPTLVMLGNGHLDFGWLEHMGRTGLLNFFQKLKETDTSWQGIKVTSIQHLVGMHPKSKSTNKRSQYHWVEETVSVEGPYLEDLMGTLRGSGGSVGDGAAAAGAMAS